MYAADAAIERTVQDVLTVPDWNNMLSGAQRSAFVDGAASGTRTLPNGAVINLGEATNMINCGKLTTCSATEMNTSTEDRPWGLNNPRYQLFAYGPSNQFIETGTLNSPFYVIVWVADDPAEDDDDPTTDGNSATNKGIGRHPVARRGLGRPRRTQDHRSDAHPHRLDRNRTRVHRSARTGRTEPARAQGRGADARRCIDAKRTDDSVGREIRIMSQTKWGGRVVAGAMVLAAILARPEAASAQLDPLLMIKKGTPAAPVKPNVIFAIDTSARMQDDADGTYYDPYDYVRGGLLLNPWELSLDVDPPTSRYRRKYINMQHSNSSDRFDCRPNRHRWRSTSRRRTRISIRKHGCWSRASRSPRRLPTTPA